MQDIKNELLALLLKNDLLRAATMVGKIESTDFSIEQTQETLLELASEVWNKSARCRKDPIYKAEMLCEVLFRDFGIKGKSEKYKPVIDDPNRYYLHHVLDSKMGSPLTLTLLYLILARQVGITADCIALPNLYLLKISDIDFDFYIDPFDSGRFLSEEEFQKKFRASAQKRLLSSRIYEVMSDQHLVGKLIQQLKHIYIVKGNAVAALRAVELLTVLFPEIPEHTRDRGILYCEMEYFSKAIADLKFYLDRRPQAEDFPEIKKLANMLRGYREIIN